MTPDLKDVFFLLNQSLQSWIQSWCVFWFPSSRIHLFKTCWNICNPLNHQPAKSWSLYGDAYSKKNTRKWTFHCPNQGKMHDATQISNITYKKRFRTGIIWATGKIRGLSRGRIRKFGGSFRWPSQCFAPSGSLNRPNHLYGQNSWE